MGVEPGETHASMVGYKFEHLGNPSIMMPTRMRGFPDWSVQLLFLNDESKKEGKDQ